MCIGKRTRIKYNKVTSNSEVRDKSANEMKTMQCQNHTRGKKNHTRTPQGKEHTIS